ncbi:alpha/beta fold hydrolase [Klebsiella aerogenes]
MKSMQLQDGRQLGWCEWGPQNGKPVVFCTGAGMSGSLGFGEVHLEKLGLRLISPHRPGCANSSMHSEKSLHSWGLDVAELLAREKLQACHVVGFSMGVPFAMALHETCAVESMAIVAGQDQFGYPETYNLLPDDVQAMLVQLRSNPAEFEQWLAGNASADWLWNFIMNSSSELDKAVYSKFGFAKAYRHCLDEGFAQGGMGYARDLINAWGEWSVTPEEVDCPVVLWFGAEDRSSVHSPDGGELLRKRFANAQRFFLDNAGGSILWTHAREILQSL